MDLRTYRFSSAFAVGAPRERVHDVLVDLEHYGEWWPQVRAVAKVDDDHALVVCRSALPYHLELELEARRRDVDLLEVGLDGALRGWARFHLTPEHPGRTAVRFEQQVRAEAPVFALASYLARPLLTWNHHRMMVGAERGLQKRLEPSDQASDQPSDQPRAATAAS
jgi:uncharacterized protein YndB with AHSA1/START domain